MGINPEHFMFYTQDDSRYRANAGAKGIAPTSDLYNGTARVMGAVLAPAWGAAASQAAYGTANTVSNAIDDFARAGYSRAAATPTGMSGMDITTYPGQASRTMHLNMQTPVTVNEAVVNHTFVPTAFPYGFKKGGILKAQNGGSLENIPQYTVIKDTTYTRPLDKQQINEIVVKGNDGNFYRQIRLNGVKKDKPVIVPGYYIDNNFVSEGDAVAPNTVVNFLNTYKPLQQKCGGKVEKAQGGTSI